MQIVFLYYIVKSIENQTVGLFEMCDKIGNFNVLFVLALFDRTQYPWKCFQWCCLPEGHINWNKGQVSLTLVCPQNFPSTFLVGYFVSNDSTRNEYKGNCWVITFTEFSAIWLWRQSTSWSTATQLNTRTKRQFGHLWQPVPNDVNSD